MAKARRSFTYSLQIEPKPKYGVLMLHQAVDTFLIPQGILFDSGASGVTQCACFGGKIEP